MLKESDDSASCCKDSGGQPMVGRIII